MNKKIENLIEELKRECQKQGVSIICTAQKEGELKSLVYGETTEILLCLAMQEEHLDENLHCQHILCVELLWMLTNKRK